MNLLTAQINLKIVDLIFDIFESLIWVLEDRICSFIYPLVHLVNIMHGYFTLSIMTIVSYTDVYIGLCYSLFSWNLLVIAHTKNGQAGFSPIRLLFSCVLQSNFLWTFRVLSFSIKNQLKEQFNSWNITMSKWKVNWPDMNNTYWKTLIRSNYKHGNFVLCYKSKVISMCTVYYPQIRIQSWLRKWPEIQTWNFA